ncbi:flippase-like domain-containing protein [Aquiflexum sp. TKW24L]|uniref:lysylphosphatidylglycerol synthase transmembrane domain-containing protein n=1 Tax=Aquiflexum sp. TKW24L TaxID=2942212 RepID=UPI0020BED0E4|nr:flippase-like domain-containing protein [Aquiflexum sp. TKW24L]
MKLNLKQWIQVAISLIVAVWIFWFLYKDISLDSLLNSVSEASFLLIGISILVTILGFWLRAWRWVLLIDAEGKNKTPTSRAFWALMVGYLTNMLVPRAGELARCGVLVKTEGAQMGKLFGTVILERTVDLLFLVLTIFLAFVIERNIFIHLFSELVSVETLGDKITKNLPLLIGGLLVLAIFFYFAFLKYRESNIFKKLRHFARDLVKGIISIRQVRNQSGFWGSSLAIWVIYYITLVLVAWAIPSTANLSLSSLLMVMVMGSIGMVAPVQGGIGTFHALVAFILIAYGLSEEEGKIFAVIVHSSQVVTIVVLGLVSLGIFFKITSNKEPKSS